MHQTETDRAQTATILPFRHKRGRPKSERPSHDLGTPELIMRRAMGDTAEAIDLCLERGIITPEQHWCGIHLRWLYTLRYGAPGIRAIDPTHLGGAEIKTDDPEWRNAREKEYNDAIILLGTRGFAPMLLNLCIYNERPKFLSLRRPVTAKRVDEATAMLAAIRDGFDLLITLWNRKKTPRS